MSSGGGVEEMRVGDYEALWELSRRLIEGVVSLRLV